MADLIAQGARINERWRRELPVERSVLLGRDGEAWAVPWEPFLSRRHAELTWRRGHLEVRRLPEARNPIYFRGDACERFLMHPADHFIIGQTMFLVALEPGVTEVEHEPVQERTFRPAPAGRAGHLAALAGLPELLRAAPAERLAQLASMLLTGMPGAEAAALLAVEAADGPPRLLHGERRQGPLGELPLSRRLVREACRRGASVLHIWSAAGGESFTQADSLDWALCTPVGGQARAIYVTGRFQADDATTVIDDAEAGGLARDIPFVELLAQLWQTLESRPG